MIDMQDATLLRLALINQCGSAESAHYIKIGDGRWCMQWHHAIVRAELIILNRDGRLRMLRANSFTTLVYEMELGDSVDLRKLVAPTD